MQRTKSQNVPFYQFDAFTPFADLAHGVFTRHGGVSTGYFDSLNVGSTVGDDPDCVMENRNRLAGALGLRDEETRFTHQVHGADVFVVYGDTAQSSQPPPGDGIITNVPGLGLVMRYADCVPVMLYDPAHRAIGVAHAGWKGTVLRAGAATAEAMVAHYGSRPSDLIAGIGPSIGPCCYEVGPEVVDAIQSAFPNADVLIQPSNNGRGAHLDLWRANEIALRELGVQVIEVSQICTSCNREFYSHRRDQGKTGRFGVLMSFRARA